jgi:hypothetical protein
MPVYDLRRGFDMSVIEDSRKVLQDFMAPELRGIAARLDALEKRGDSLDRKIDEVDRRAEKRHDQLIQLSEKRHDEVMGVIRQVVDWTSVQQRLARLESKDAPHQ